MAVAAMVLPALLTGIVATREGKAQQQQRLQASALMQEAVEAARSVREQGWTAFATDGTYHPAAVDGQWQLAPGPETVGSFTRSVQVASAFRDGNGQIVESGGTLDPSTKKATVRVSWPTPFASEVTSLLIFTRYLDNDALSQTTAEDFNTGTTTDTTVTTTDGGAIVLASGAIPNWCAPNLQITPLDLPKNGVANAISAIQGKVFAGTGDNASGVSYATANITDTRPPIPSILNTFNGFKTNSIFGEANYAYLGTDTNAKEIVIIDISGGSPSEVGLFNSPGPGSGDSVFVSGNTGFMIDRNTLYSFNLDSKSGSRPQIGSVGLSGNGRKVVVVGSYAYIAIDAGSQLQIVDVSNPGSMSVVGQASLAGAGGRDIYVRSDGNRAYLATGASGSQAEFFIVDTSTKTGDRPTVGSYDTNGMNPRGVTLVPGNKAIVVGANGDEYQVIDITNETSPVSCGSLNIDTGVNGLASVLESDGDAFSYIITGDADTELKIIEGFGGGTTATGSFESSTFDAGYSAAFNRFWVSETEPSGTSVRYQMSVAAPVAGSCDGVTFDFLGPDGTAATFFEESGAIPLLNSGNYQNPGRCFRYKVFLSSADPNISPQFSDITINYSP